MAKRTLHFARRLAAVAGVFACSRKLFRRRAAASAPLPHLASPPEPLPFMHDPMADWLFEPSAPLTQAAERISERSDALAASLAGLRTLIGEIQAHRPASLPGQRMARDAAAGFMHDADLFDGEEMGLLPPAGPLEGLDAFLFDDFAGETPFERAA